ncbi:hypothetical protein [Streptomyces sp. SID13031]|nr:hypothetical protein [Streptomyces sp. SID13031]NEA33084.1 hypothetical protein [Streptomyces sp. SID13031]
MSSLLGAIGLLYLRTGSLVVTIVGALMVLIAGVLFLVLGRHYRWL